MELANNKINHLNVFQCDSCFNINNIAYGLYEECVLCRENNTSVIFDKCGHCICEKCAPEITNGVCIICKSKNNQKIWPHTHMSAESCYFEKVDPEVKKYFKKLHLQTKDTIGKKITMPHGLYILCVYYHKFLQLLHLNNNLDKLSPPKMIDKIWRAHLSDNESYNNTCILIYKYILFRDPLTSDVGYEKTVDLYKKTFGDDLISFFWPAICQPKIEKTRATVQLFVRTMYDTTITVNIKNGCTIQQIKEYIQDKQNIPWNQLRLIYKCYQLEDEKTILDYGITHESTLHLRLRLRGD
jgi:hypothetical protein